MKIKDDNIGLFIETDHVIQKIKGYFHDILKTEPIDEISIPVANQQLETISPNKVRRLFFTKKVLDEIEKVSISDKTDLRLFQSIPDRKDTYIFRDQICVRYIKKGTLITGMICFINNKIKQKVNEIDKRTEEASSDLEKMKQDINRMENARKNITDELSSALKIDDDLLELRKLYEEAKQGGNDYLSYLNLLKNTFSDKGYFHWGGFYIDTTRGIMGYGNEKLAGVDMGELVNDLFLKTLAYVELSNVELKLIDPNRSIGTRKSGKYLNESKKPIIIVDSNWNTTIIRTEGFNVSGHFRLQRCGKNWSDVKLTWINTYDKKGYIRTAKKLKE